MENFSLTEQELNSLHAEHKFAKRHSAKKAYRINAIILLGTGWTLEGVSNALLLNQETLRTYVKKFRHGGTKCLLENNYAGKQSFLDASEKAELSRYLEKNLIRTTWEVREYVKQAFNVTYTRSGMTNLLHALDFTYKKPTLIPSAIDVQAQAEFIDYFKSFIENKTNEEVVVFYDSSHPQYQSHASYGWIKKGKNALLQNHGMRGRVNISGGIDFDTGMVIVEYPEKVNALSTINMLDKIQSYYPKSKRINIVLDNASSHRSRLVKDYVRNTKINLVYLPPYSPNLNLMERIWGLMHRYCLSNSFSEKFSIFLKKIKRFFKKVIPKKIDEWVMPLLTEEFQVFEGNLVR